MRPVVLLVIAVATFHGARASGLFTNEELDRQAEAKHEFGLLPGEFRDVGLDAVEPLKVEFSSHIGKVGWLPVPRLSDAERAENIFPAGVEFRTIFWHYHGHRVFELTEPGFYGAMIEATPVGGEGSFVRRVVQVVENEQLIGDDTSEAEALRRFAGQKLGRAWGPSDAALSHFAHLFWWEMASHLNNEQSYQFTILEPPDMDLSKSEGRLHPVLIALHEVGTLFETIEDIEASDHAQTFRALAKRGVIVVLPMAKEGWQAPALARLVALLRSSSMPVDPEQFSLAGIGSGADGVFAMLDALPGEWASATCMNPLRMPDADRAKRFQGIALRVITDGSLSVEQAAAVRRRVGEFSTNGLNVTLETSEMLSQSREGDAVSLPFFSTLDFTQWLLNQRRPRDEAKNHPFGVGLGQQQQAPVGTQEEPAVAPAKLPDQR